MTQKRNGQMLLSPESTLIEKSYGQKLSSHDHSAYLNNLSQTISYNMVFHHFKDDGMREIW